MKFSTMYCSKYLHIFNGIIWDCIIVWSNIARALNVGNAIGFNPCQEFRRHTHMNHQPVNFMQGHFIMQHLNRTATTLTHTSTTLSIYLVCFDVTLLADVLLYVIVYCASISMYPCQPYCVLQFCTAIFTKTRENVDIFSQCQFVCLLRRSYIKVNVV